MSKRTHWEGGIRYARGTRLPGWPCCCSGDRAEQIAERGEQTANPAGVDCARCLRLMRQDEREWVRDGARRATTLRSVDGGKT